MIEGIELTLKSLLDVVRKYGIEIVGDVNVPFNGSTSGDEHDGIRRSPAEPRDDGDAEKLYAERPPVASGDGCSLQSQGVIASATA